MTQFEQNLFNGFKRRVAELQTVKLDYHREELEGAILRCMKMASAPLFREMQLHLRNNGFQAK